MEEEREAGDVGVGDEAPAAVRGMCAGGCGGGCMREERRRRLRERGASVAADAVQGSSAGGGCCGCAREHHRWRLRPSPPASTAPRRDLRHDLQHRQSDAAIQPRPSPRGLPNPPPLLLLLSRSCSAKPELQAAPAS
jgi:hypothetical protein